MTVGDDGIGWFAGCCKEGMGSFVDEFCEARQDFFKKSSVQRMLELGARFYCLTK